MDNKKEIQDSLYLQAFEEWACLKIARASDGRWIVDCDGYIGAVYPSLREAIADCMERWDRPDFE